MKKQMLTILLIMVGMLIGAGTVEAAVTFDDGLIHDIDYQINDDVRIDYQTTVNILPGGRINGRLRAYGNSEVIWSGGTLTSSLWAYDNSNITIIGSNFAVDGELFGYGELTGWDGYKHLTGTLANGDLLDNRTYICGDGAIVFAPIPAPIPAPGAIILGSLGVGLVGWLRRICLFD